MALPQTLLEMRGATWPVPRWSESVLIIIDAQEEYRSGVLPLHGIDAAIRENQALLAAARSAGTPIIHVVTLAPAGAGMFETGSPLAEIFAELTPLPNEVVVLKMLPDSFAGTDLADHLKRFGRPTLIVSGFMTHMCVSTTVRSAMHQGYRCALVANACATRDLPDGAGGVVPAEVLHRAELAALSDRFAVIVRDTTQIPI